MSAVDFSSEKILSFYCSFPSQLRDNLSRNESLSQEIMQGKPLSGMLMASLADVAWITEDGSSLSNLNSDGFFDEESFIEDCNPQKETEELASTDQSDLDNIGKEELSNNSEAMQKISALEEELQKLRAQIAMMIVANPQSQVSVGTTLTPAGAPVPPLPPPPPPPPPPTLASTPLKPVSQIIREVRHVAVFLSRASAYVLQIIIINVHFASPKMFPNLF